MTRTTLIFTASCLYIALLFFSACKKDPTESDSKEYMTGALVHNMPQYAYKSKVYTFTVSGITNPEEGLSYSWVASSFIPDSCDTQSFTCLAPEQTGTYYVSVTVSHDDYYSNSGYQYITVIDSLFFKCLTDIVPGTDSIADPRDGSVYHIRMYGDLEWFVQNLNWAGAGNTYAKAEAFGTPYGRLYSWREATTDIAAFGLGAGPQGVCPPGWSVPTNEDWAHLATVVNNGNALSFFDDWVNLADPLCVYAKLNDDYVWPYSPRNTKSNVAFWNGLPGGNSTNGGNNYGNLNNYGFWLSSSEADADNGYYRYINYDINRFPYHQTDKDTFGASVRCVRLSTHDE